MLFELWRFFLLCLLWGILFGCPVVFGCGWFEWLSAARAVEILSPISSLGYHVGDAQLIFLFGVGSNGAKLFDLGRSLPIVFLGFFAAETGRVGEVGFRLGGWRR